MFEMTGMVLVALFGVGVPAGLVVRYFLFRLGCTLADLPEPSVGRSMVAVVAALAVTVPLILVGDNVLASLKLTTNGPEGALYYPGMACILVFCWLLAAVVYWLVLSTSYTRGLIVSGIELLLSGLLGGLVAALVLIIGAGWQIANKPRPQSQLPASVPLALPRVVGS